MDSIIRIWDLPTGHLIDGIKTRSIVTALAWSGCGEFLVTGHVDDVGVSLWTNRTLFTRAPTRHLEEEDIVELSMPSSSGEGGVSIIDSALQNANEYAEDTGIYISKDQLSEKMLTLSLVPKVKWQTLLHLDLIKQRNKPTSVVQKPKSAPFFLGALSSMKDGNTSLITNPSATTNPDGNPLYAFSVQAEEALALAEAEKSRVLRLQPANNKMANGTVTTSSTLLRACSTHEADAFAKYIDHLKTLSPASADLEIRSLDTSYWINNLASTSDGNTADGWLRPPSSHSDSESDSDSEHTSANTIKHIEELTTFISALTSRLSLHRDWELVNAWMNVFLKVHGELIVNICTVAAQDTMSGYKRSSLRKRAGRLRAALEEWRGEQTREGKRISDLAGYCAGVVAFLRSRN